MSLTISEIRGQYDALDKTVARMREFGERLKAFWQSTRPRAVVFTGCGSSFSLCRSFLSLAGMRLSLPVYALAAGDLWLNCARYRRMLDGALVVSVSRSGRTSEALRAMEAVQGLSVGARFLSIVCREDTPMERLSEMTVTLPWAFDESVCQTRCVGNLYAAGMMLVALWAGAAEEGEAFTRLARLGNEYLARIEAPLQALAELNWDRAVVLADGEIDGLAEEGSLAFKEICQLPSNYHHILDVRHGPMVLLGPGTLVLAARKSPDCVYETQLLRDVRKKGALIAAYSNEPIGDGVADVEISLGADVGFVAGGLGLLSVCQLTAYYKALLVGCDPDKPDGLDPWIQI